MLIALALIGCRTEPLPDLDYGGTALKRFETCEELRAYTGDVMLETLLQNQYGYGWAVLDSSEGDDSSGGDGPSDYTTTNNQEEGVDELDLVKTNGEYIFVAQDRDLQIVSSWPVEDSSLVATAPVEGWARGLFLHQDRVVVISYVYGEDFLGQEYGWGTRLTAFDVSDPANPTELWHHDTTGWLADARLIDGTVTTVIDHWLPLPQEAWELLQDEDMPEPTWEDEASMLAQMEEARPILEPKVDELVRGLSLDQLIPLTARDGGAPETLLDCDEIWRTPEPSQFSMLSVLQVDMQGNGALSGTGVYSDGWTVYASQDNLYVAQSSWWRWWGWGDLDMNTQVHRFSLEDSGVAYSGTGTVDGYVYDQFAMSEYEGHLRVASTEVDWWWGTQADTEEPANLVTVLEVETMDEVGRLDGMAPNEQIRAVRMMGDTGYVVTFEQIDPLFTVDLSDPTNPTLLGELKIPGFSAYLHPMDDDHLLAVGMAGEDDGTLTGLAVSIFDVSDLSAPALAHSYELPTENWSGSEALWDHHAFTYHRGVLSIPVYTYDEEWDWFSGLVAFDISATDGISERGRVDHRDLVDKSECYYSVYYDYGDEVCSDWGWYATVRRSVYIEDNLFSISNYGIKVNDLNDPSVQIAEVLFHPANAD